MWCADGLAGEMVEINLWTRKLGAKFGAEIATVKLSRVREIATVKLRKRILARDGK